MSTSSNDRDTPDTDRKADTAGQPSPDKPAMPGVARSSQAALLAAALAAAGATPAAGAVPTVDSDRAYLEALLHGSWSQPPELGARGMPGVEAAQPTDEFDVAAGAFNNSFNPHPTPYHDQRYGDSAFGDRSDRR